MERVAFTPRILYGDYGNPFGQGAAANSGESVWVWWLVAGGWWLVGDALMVCVWTLDEAKDFVQKIEDGKKRGAKEIDAMTTSYAPALASIYQSVINQSIKKKHFPLLDLGSLVRVYDRHVSIL